MHGTDTGTGQHGDGQLGNHLHIDANAVALGDPQGFQGVGEAAHLVQQLGIAQLARFRGVIALPDQGRLLAGPGFDVPIKTVVGDVQLAAQKPLGLSRMKIPLQDAIPFFEPADKGVGLLGPEPFRVVYRALIHLFVGVRVDGSLAFDCGRNIIDEFAALVFCHIPLLVFGCVKQDRRPYSLRPIASMKRSWITPQAIAYKASRSAVWARKPSGI